MKQEIKERVERIRKGEVPEGYKATKVGIIPEEWEVKKLEKTADIIDPHPSHRAPKATIDGIPFVGIGDISINGAINYDKCRIVDETIFEEHSQRYNLKDGLIGIGRVASIGKVIKFKDNIGKYTISPTLAVIKPKNVDSDFLFFILNSKYTDDQFSKIKNGSTRNSVGIMVLRKIQIRLPLLSEQQKIAEILSTWDKTINLKEKLIEEKKEFKRGLMQKLLTGKTRFPEFTDEWVETYLNKIVEKINDKNDEKDQTIVTISAKKGFINQSEYFNKIVASKDLSGYYLIKKGDFAYNKSYSNGYPVGVIKRLESFEKAVVTTLYICFRIKDQTVSSNFLKYYFDSVLLNRQIKRIANEGGRAHGLLNVTPRDFFNIKIKIPDILEQEQIADVLISQDKKIHLMELTLDHLKEQKKGLMQLLLTGIVRVEVD